MPATSFGVTINLGLSQTEILATVTLSCSLDGDDLGEDLALILGRGQSQARDP